MNSTHIKAAIFAWLRYDRGFSLVATEVECNYSISDVMAYEDGQFIEVEIKTSLADFKNDFKKVAGRHINKHALMESWNGRTFIPNRFYFAIPEKLESKVVAFMDEAGKSSLGLLVVDHRLQVRAAKTTRLLRPVDSSAFSTQARKVHMRSTSQLGNILLKQAKASLVDYVEPDEDYVI